MSDAETPLVGANVETVVRVGETVRRTTGPWTPSVHALLRHLEDSGFEHSPRVFGLDDQGREILTYVPGRTAFLPWPEEVRSDESLASAARLIREYHSAVEGFVPPKDSVWRLGSGRPGPGEIICHNDLAPWNTVYSQDGTTTHLIDWDFARPGLPIEDVAYAAWTFTPLRDDAKCSECGWEQPPDRASRLRVFLDAYGLEDRGGFVAAVIERKQLEKRWLIELGARDVHPWKKFLDEGHAEHVDYDIAWLEQNRGELEAACRV